MGDVGVPTGVDTDLAAVAGKQPARPAFAFSGVYGGRGVWGARCIWVWGVLTGVDTDLAAVAGEQPARPAARHTAIVASRVRLLGGVWGCGVYRGRVYMGVGVLTGVDTDLAGVAGEQPARPAARHTAVVAGRVRLLGTRREAHVWDERRRWRSRLRWRGRLLLLLRPRTAVHRLVRRAAAVTRRHLDRQDNSEHPAVTRRRLDRQRAPGNTAHRCNFIFCIVQHTISVSPRLRPIIVDTSAVRYCSHCLQSYCLVVRINIQI